jgi:hypothetical protein
MVLSPFIMLGVKNRTSPHYSLESAAIPGRPAREHLWVKNDERLFSQKVGYSRMNGRLRDPAKTDRRVQAIKL